MKRRWRTGLAALAGVPLSVLAGLAIAAYLVFENIGAHRERVESYLSAATGGIVRIGELSSGWSGIVPELRAIGVRLRDAQDRHTLLRVGEMRLRPKLLSLLRGQLAFRSIVLDRPTVELERLEDGRIVLGEMEGTGDGSPLSGFLAQERLVVNDGTLIWRDRREPGHSLVLPGIYLMSRQEGESHRFQGGARPPETLSQSLRWEGSLSGSPEGGDLAGHLRLDATGLVLARLPKAVSESLPVSLAGSLDMRLSIIWREGAWVEASAQTRLVEPQIRMRQTERVLQGDLLSADLELTRAGDGWRLRARQPEWVKGVERFAPGELSLERSGSETTVAFKDIDLAGLSGVLRALALPGEREHFVAQLRPRGRVLEGKATFGGDWQAAGPLALMLRFRDLSFEGQEGFPGVAGLDGMLDYRRPEGRARLDSEGVTLDLRRPKPLRVEVARLEGDVTWRRRDDGWTVTGENFVLRNADAEFHSGRFELDWPFEAGQSPTLRAAADLRHVSLPRIPAYVPEIPQTEKFRKWYARALHAGRAVAGHIETEGSLDRFPYAQGGGRLEGWARVHDLELDFAPGFPLAHVPTVEVGFRDSELSFRSTDGRLDQAPVPEVQVRLPAIFDKGRHVFVEGRADVKPAEGLAFLQQGPLFRDEKVVEMFRQWKAEGQGELKLKLDVPLKEPKESRVEGSYEFSASTARFLDRLPIREIKARVQFTERSAAGEAKASEFLGGPVEVKLSTAMPGRPPTLVFDFAGRALPARLAEAFLPKLAGHMSGSVAWTGRVETRKGGFQASLASNLNGVRLDLPEPLHKTAESAVPLAVEYSAREGVDAQFTARLGERTSLALALAKTEGRWKPVAGEIVTGDRQAATTTGGRGLRLRLRQPFFDLDAWLAFLRPYLDGSGEGESLAVVHVRGRTENLRFLERNWGWAALSAESPDGRAWTATLNGERFAGNAHALLAHGNHAYRLTLARLHLPASEGEGSAVRGKPAGQPRLEITAEDFRYDGRGLGRLELQAQPKGDSWEIGKLTLRQPSLAIAAKGTWSGEGEGESRFELTAESDDFGAALKALALAQRVEGGEGRITAGLHWPGGPGRFSKDRVEGTIEIDVRRGRFLAVEAGAGRLFGLLNLDALERRLRLDFSDVFGKGTPFDHFGGKASLGAGDLSLEGFVIVGPSLYLEAEGRIGLAREDFDLDLIVAPPLGGNLSLIGALINPIYGAVMYVTQKVFRRQLARLVYYRYRVVGPWDRPGITRVKHEPEASAVPALP